MRARSGTAATNLRSFHISRGIARMVRSMWTVLLILLVAWAVLSIVGFVFEGLLWLAIIGIVLFVGTLLFGLIRRSVNRTKS